MKGMNVSGCHSFNCLENAGRTTAVSLPTALSLQDYHVQVMFCQWSLRQCGTNHNFPAFVIFTDVAHFTRDEIQNFQNHLWVHENPHVILLLHHQQRFPINICAGDNLFGPNVLPNILQGGITKLSWKTMCLIS
jgi:hypothetical protein